MCGRYALFETDKLEQRFSVNIPVPIKPNYNVAPTQTMPVIRNVNGSKELQLMRWGIPRVLGKEKIIKPFNTRADKAFAPFWKKQVTTQRVLVPANAFYEWRQSDKTPFLIEPKDEQLYAFAGIWNSWTDNEGNTFDSYSIMTTDPNKEMKSVHERMPVMLHLSDEDRWLQDDLSQSSIEEMLLPCEDNRLKLIEISSRVGSVKNNDPSIMEAAN